MLYLLSQATNGRLSGFPEDKQRGHLSIQPAPYAKEMQVQLEVGASLFI